MDKDVVFGARIYRSCKAVLITFHFTEYLEIDWRAADWYMEDQRYLLIGIGIRIRELQVSMCLP